MSFSASISGHLTGDDAGQCEARIKAVVDGAVAEIIAILDEPRATLDTLSYASFAGQFTGSTNYLAEPTWPK